MNSKTKRILSVSLFAVCALSFMLFTTVNTTPSKAEGQSAAFVSTDTATGANWEGTYGQEGYFIWSGVQSVYSNAYEDYTTTGESIALTGWTTSGSSWLTVDGENSGLKAELPIDKWSFSGRQWKVATVNGATALNVPGTNTPTGASVYGWTTSGLKDASISINKTSEEDINFTLYYVGHTDITNAAGKNVKVAVYSGANLAKNETGIGHYGTELASKVVYGETDDFSVNRYFTFTLTGTGEFQIVIMDASTVTQNTEPRIGGFFIDSVASASSASFIGADNSAGRDWENSNYGKDGYVVLSSTSNKVYSDLYTEAGKSGDELITLAGWNNSTPTWMTLDGEYGLNADAPIDKWAITGRNWKEVSDNNQSLYIPGAQTGTDAAFYGYGSGSSIEDTSLIINKVGAGDLYLTLYVANATNIKPTYIYVVEGANFTKPNPNLMTTDAVENYYGTNLLEERVEVSVSSCYITFKLEGEGMFQIVACDKTANDSVVGRFGGFFFDTKNPFINVDAEFVSVASGYGTDWAATNYGADGKVIFTSDGTTTNGVKIYSDMYSLTISDLISMTGWEHSDSNDYLTPTTAGAELDSAIMDKWAFTGRAWKVGGSGEAVGLDKPDGTTQILRTDGFGNDIQDSSVVISKISDADVYITLFISSSNYKTVNAANPLDLYVYKGATLTKTGNGTMNHYAGELLCKRTLTDAVSFITVKLTGAGIFQFVATRGTDENGDKIGNSVPYFGGFFFDEEQPAIHAPSKKGASLTLDGDIGLNFYVNIPCVKDTMQFKFTYADGSESLVDVPARDNNFSYKFTTTVMPKDYEEDVEVCLLDGETTVIDAWTYSVETYCDTVLSNTSDYSEKLVNLCGALLNYCKASKAYLGKTAMPALDMDDVSVSDLESYGLTTTGTLPAGLTIIGMSLLLENKTTLRVYYQKEVGAEITVRRGDNVLEQVKNGNRYYVDVIANVGAQQLGTMFAIVFEDGVSTYTVNVSALSYAYSALYFYGDDDEKANLITISKALYLYNVAAEEYFA